MTDDQRKAIVEAVNQEGYYCYYIKTENHSEIFQIYDEVSDLRLKCELTPQFPFEFPKMYLFQEFAEKHLPLPHISCDNFVCTYDSNTAFPNFDNPAGVVAASAKQAFETILKGINKENEDDFVDEFTAYWDRKGVAYFHLLYNPCDSAKLLYSYGVEGSKLYIISNSKEKLETYFRYFTTIQYDEQKIDRCLYIPLNKNIRLPFPSTNQDFFQLVQNGSDYFADYESFLNNRRKPSLVLFSQPYKTGKIFAGWIHPAFSKSGDGFRKNRLSSRLACLAVDKNDKVQRADVTIISKRRLFMRGGDGTMDLDQKISVCGCGSIGSYLVEILSELSLNHFTLVDNDVLSHDNIARHFCGVEYAYKNKPEAIREKLIKHYADIDCIPRKDNILDIIQNETEFFNSFDYNFLVVGSTPVELALLRKFQSGEIRKPIIVLWVEPYLLGGHAIVLNKKCDVESVLYNDADFSFKYHVLENGREFLKKEAGCQCTFIPYSGFEAKKFLYDFCDYFNNNIIGKDFRNVLFSWGGKLDWARSEGIDLSTEWLAKKDRTIVMKEL